MRNKLLVISAGLSAVTLAAAMSVQVWVFGSGSATESDRGSAMSEAVDQATQQANAICTGVVVTTETTGSFCTTSDDGNGNMQYSCTAMVKSLCQVGR